MAGQLLPLRLLSTPGLLRVSRAAFDLGRATRATPFRLKAQPFPAISHLLVCPRDESGIRSFSSRTARSRTGSADGSRGRGGFRTGNSAGAGQGRGLIDEEAELSDWISDLKTESFRLGMNSEGDEENRGDRGRGGRDRDRDNRGGGRGRDSMMSTQNRGGRSGFGGASDGRRSRGSGGFSERNSRGALTKKRLDSDLEDENEEEERGFSSRGRNAITSMQKQGGRSGYGGVSDGRKSQSSVGFSERNSRRAVPKRRFESDLEDEDDEEEGGFSSKGSRGNGSRGGISSVLGRKGERDLGSSYKQGRGVRGSVLAVSDEEEEDDDALSGFEDDLFGDKVDEKERDVSNLFKSASSLEGDSVSRATTSSGGDKDSYLSQTRFDQCPVSPLTLKGIKAAGYERMTLVQEATLPAILKGKDVLAKARTGTGKTVAFLLPAIEIVAKLPPVDRDQKRPPINVLVICPTRELADQAATEANTLLKFHPSIGVQVVIGGTRLALEQKRMQANPCQILVATPGRLRDHIENTPGFATRLMGVKVLVLDEADRLLDMGFRKDIEKIVAAVPKHRQTLLFSATVPDEVRQICYIAMKRDHEFINTVEEGSEETHSQVRQMHLVAPLEKQFPILYALLKEHISEDVDYKVIVFCTTAMVTKLVADLLSELRLNVREIHSRKPQSYRTRVSKEFKESKGLILVSSDVSARGVDYPDVTLVVQVGVPADREQYIHRLGRTGRKGKEGQGILMLAPWEEFFLSSIKDLPLTKAPLPSVDPDTCKKVERALGHVEMKSKESAYQAWLGYYNSNKNVGRDKYKLVLLANEFSRSMGLDNPPAIAKLVLRKMGLTNVPGLRAK